MSVSGETQALLWNIAEVAGTTIVFAVVLRLLVLANRRFGAWMQTRIPSDLKVRGYTLLSATQLRSLAASLFTLLSWIVGLLGTYLWLTFILTRFAATHGYGRALAHWLIGRLLLLITGVAKAIPGLFTAGLMLVAARFAAKQTHRIFDAVEAGTLSLPGVHVDTAAPTRRLAVAAIWLFATIAAYPYLPGSESEAFKGVGVMLGLIVSLGSSGLANQAMSGLVLMYARSLRQGDFIVVGEHQGTVSELGLLATKIITSFGEEVTIPNAVMVSSATTNASRNGDGVVIRTAVTIGYDAPWRQVHALLELAARRTPGVLAEPKPIILQRALSDFYPEYTLAVRCATAGERPAVLSALHASIQDCFNEFGVQILSPHFIANPPQPAVVPPSKWHAAPAEPEPETDLKPAAKRSA